MKNENVLFNISNDKYGPKGDPKIGYPQLCIRTNRTAQRSNLNQIIKIADQAANQFPINDKENRSKAVIKTLSKQFGDGGWWFWSYLVHLF